MERSETGTQAGAKSLSYTVIENVAEHKGTEALMLDPDALDVLFSGEDETRCNGNISFEYSGCTVTVSSDGHVLVEDVEDDSVGEPTIP